LPNRQFVEGMIRSSSHPDMKTGPPAKLLSPGSPW
jgi:hypothetical protein